MKSLNIFYILFNNFNISFEYSFIMIVGHEHWLEYSNQEYDHEWKYMDTEYGPIVLNCTDKELLFSGTREVHQVYGERFHQFTVGHTLAFDGDPTCPYKDMDVNLKWRSIVKPAQMTLEITEDLFKAVFMYDDESVPYSVFIHKNQTSK